MEDLVEADWYREMDELSKEFQENLRILASQG
jgi:hypothetical protein